MNGSYNFLFHLLGFGLLMGLYLRGAMFERAVRAESDWRRKALVLNLMNSGAWLGPVSALVLLLTGFGNIYNRYWGATEPIHVEGWIIGKLVLFVIFILNGATAGRIFSRQRAELVHGSMQVGGSVEEERKLRRYNRWMSAFYIVQGLLLLMILMMAAFGSLKHPGVF